MLGSEIIDELSAANLAFGSPNQKGTDPILPKNGVEQSAGLFFAPNKRPLNIWQPKPAIFVWIVQEADDFSKRVFGCLHVLPRIAPHC